MADANLGAGLNGVSFHRLSLMNLAAARQLASWQQLVRPSPS